MDPSKSKGKKGSFAGRVPGFLLKITPRAARAPRVYNIIIINLARFIDCVQRYPGLQVSVSHGLIGLPGARGMWRVNDSLSTFAV